jgi:PAS domain S-box-containing protein
MSDLLTVNIQNSVIDEIVLKWDIFQKAPIGVYIIQDRKFKAMNNEFISYTGYSENELLEINPLDIVSESFRESVKKNAIEMLQSKRDKPYEYLATTKDGQEFGLSKRLFLVC